MKKSFLAKLIVIVLSLTFAFSVIGCNVVNVECSHDKILGTDLVCQNGEYYYEQICPECNVSELIPAVVVKDSDKWLYTETEHWNSVKCATTSSNSRAAVNTPMYSDYKVNRGGHDYDDKGLCTVCHYLDKESEGLEYVENEDNTGYIVVGFGECLDEHINIPAEHNGKPVVGIGANAFADSKRPAHAVGPDKPGHGFDPDKGEGEDPDRPGHEPESDDVVESEPESEIESMPEEDDGEEEVEPLRVLGITIPDTVIHIDCTAFAGCEDLNNFIVDMANQVFNSVNNCLINKVTETLIRGCEFSVIPEDGSVTIIGSYSFANSSGLVSITIPDSIEEIGDKAFMDCEALIEVYMPENIDIGIDIFRGSVHVQVEVDHALEYVPAKEASCEEAGNIAHYVCSDCGWFFADTQERERIYEVVIPASHDFVNGVCTKCGKVEDELLIINVDTVPHLGAFPLGTLEGDLGLPANINVYTADGLTHQLPVAWDLSSYDKANEGTYTIRGVIQQGNFHFAEGLTNSIETTVEILESMNGVADIVFLLDISGSMSDEIANVKNNIVRFAAAIQAMGVNARWSVVTYSDWTLEGTSDYTPGETTQIIKNGADDWFITAEDYRDTINAIQIAYGGDGPETALDGLMLAHNQLEHRTNARVFYIVLTDADCKDDNKHGVSTLEEGADILAGDNVNVSVITTNGLDYEYFFLYTTTGGILADIYGDFSQKLLDVLVPIIYGEVIS